MPSNREHPSEAEVHRLLAHIGTVETRWHRTAAWLLDYGRRNVPDDRNSKNPLKWLAAEVSCWMIDAQTRSVNRRFRND